MYTWHLLKRELIYSVIREMENYSEVERVKYFALQTKVYDLDPFSAGPLAVNIINSCFRFKLNAPL